jgi:hypothetical protein
MEFRSEIRLTKDEALDLAGALGLAAVELRRNGVFELAHRLDGYVDWLEDLLVEGP